MLKSQVSVALCALMFCIGRPAAAHAVFPGSPVSGPESAPVAAISFAASHAHYAVTFALPGRQMRKFVTSYLKENDEELAMVRERSQRPFTIIDSIMGVYDLPVELRYLAVIESELRATAVSRVGARGPWQLMAVTARDLGLKVSRRSDERTNYYKSTRAAALYLRDLHREYKDWLLVLAAYNAGPVPVNRAMRLAHSRNFWAIERYLPAETRQHVKRFIATAYYFTISQQEEELAPAGSVCEQGGLAGVYAAVKVRSAKVYGPVPAFGSVDLTDGLTAKWIAASGLKAPALMAGGLAASGLKAAGKIAGFQVAGDAGILPEDRMVAGLGRKELARLAGVPWAVAVL